MDQAGQVGGQFGERSRRGTYVAVAVVEVLVIVGLWLFSRHFGG